MSNSRKRGFELVSKEHKVHDGRLKVKLPSRKTHHSAGYDISSPVAGNIPKGKSLTIMTDIKAYMMPDEWLGLYIRSSLGAKGLQLKNIVGVIDSDYYNNEDNEGNIGLMLYNNSNENISIAKGERIAQGIFHKYLTVDDDETYAKETRSGGVGSSGKF